MQFLICQKNSFSNKAFHEAILQASKTADDQRKEKLNSHSMNNSMNMARKKNSLTIDNGPVRLSSLRTNKSAQEARSTEKQLAIRPSYSHPTIRGNLNQGDKPPISPGISSQEDHPNNKPPKSKFSRPYSFNSRSERNPELNAGQGMPRGSTLRSSKESLEGQKSNTDYSNDFKVNVKSPVEEDKDSKDKNRMGNHLENRKPHSTPNLPLVQQRVPMKIPGISLIVSTQPTQPQDDQNIDQSQQNYEDKEPQANYGKIRIKIQIIFHSN